MPLQPERRSRDGSREERALETHTARRAGKGVRTPRLPAPEGRGAPTHPVRRLWDFRMKLTWRADWGGCARFEGRARAAPPGARPSRGPDPAAAP